RDLAPVLLARVDVALHLEDAVLAHVGERLEALLGGALWQARHGVLEHPLEVLVDRDLLALAVGRLEVLPHAEGAIRVDAPRQLDEELVLLPDLARVRLVDLADGQAEPLARNAHDGLAE